MLFWPIFVHFWCPAVTLVTFSSNLSNFERNQRKKIPKISKNQKLEKNPKKSKKKRRKTLKSEKFKINTPTIQNLSKMVLKNSKIGKNLKKILFLRIKKIIIIILPYKKMPFS